MESSFVIQGPDGKRVVYNENGEPMRDDGKTDLAAPVPDWWVLYYRMFSGYLNSILPEHQGKISLSMCAPEEMAEFYENAIIEIDPYSSEHNGIWLHVRNGHRASRTPLHYVQWIRVALNRPGAYHIPKPYIFRNPSGHDLFGGLQLGCATHFGQANASRNCFVLPDKFVGKINAPTCPFCYEELSLSSLVENLGGTNAQAQRHLWMCRACSSSEVIPTTTIGTVARSLKHESSQENSNSSPRFDSDTLRALDPAEDTEGMGGDSSSEFNPD